MKYNKKSLKRILTKKKHSAYKLAKQLGVTRGTVSLYSTGKQIPRADMLAKWAEILEVKNMNVFFCD